MGSLLSVGFAENQLSGEIPADLANLKYLEFLALRDNQLEGEIPSELEKMEFLRILSLSGNRLEGKIPPELGRIESLTMLLLDGNRLEGEIPRELAGLVELHTLEIQDNNLNGEIPPELGALAEMNHLDLSNNQLTGDFPPELEQLTELEELVILGNQLTGCVPLELEDVLRYSDHAVSLNFGNLGFCKAFTGHAETEEISHCIHQVNTFGTIESEWRNDCILTRQKYRGKHGVNYMLDLTRETTVSIRMLSDEEDHHFSLFERTREGAELLVGGQKQIRDQLLPPGTYTIEVASWGTGPFTMSISSPQNDR